MSNTVEKVADKLPSKEELKEDVKKATSSSVQSLRALVAGGVGGVFAVVVGHPFDLIKVRMQTAERGVYTGAMDVLRKGIARDGLVKGLYAGVSAPLVGVTPMFAVSFWGYDLGKQLVTSFSKVENGQFSVAQVSAAGFFSAIPQTLITAPFERVKVLLRSRARRTWHLERSPDTMEVSMLSSSCTGKAEFAPYTAALR